MNNFDFHKFFDSLSCSEEIHDKIERSLLDLIANGFLIVQNFPVN